jgi:hypothetical protein
MTDAPGTVVPLRPAVPSRGWLGIKARPQKRYTADDWKIWGDLGEGTLIDVERGSPAWQSDLRKDMWVIAIDGASFDAFERQARSPGEVIELRAFAIGLGTFTRKITLVDPPSKTATAHQPNRKSPAWTLERPTLPGKRVYKDTRARYLEFAAQHPVVGRHMRLLAELLRRDWHRGIIPRHNTIAEALGRSRRSVQYSQSCCQHFGFLRVVSGKSKHRPNSYEVCWPAGSEPR